MRNKKGQVTIFIIIAIIIIAAVGLYFIFREDLGIVKIPASIEPVYITFLTCLEEEALTGIDILGSQAGYISLPEFEPGSRYMPFSSQLEFAGSAVPYWYYVSGNNIQREQVPSKAEMENQLAEFIEEDARDCIFDEYYGQGFEITQGEPEARVNIKENSVDVSLDMSMSIEKADERALINNHKISVNTKLGKLYDDAKKIYEQEQKDLFLEEYAIDVLRLYAPVDDVELTCSPKIWNADEIFNNLEQAIEENTMSLKTQGRADDYFVVDVPGDIEARFINSRNWARSFEVEPTEGNILIAEPIGNQPGLGILGFCYVPYHFVYSVRYPVLIQVYEEDEIFQFPMAVVIQNNNPREALEGSASVAPDIGLCENKNTLVNVQTYDTNLNSVEADISYECFGERCEIGISPLEEEFPQCINGYILTRADGFEDARYLFSTNQPGNIEIILDRFYEINVELNLDGTGYNDNAIIYFVSDKASKTIIYPEQKTVELSEREYEIQVYIYQDASLDLEETTTEQCVDVPSSGLGGLFGLIKEKCFEVEVPAQIISNVLAGGGKQSYYVLESELKSSNLIEINAQSLPVPDSLAQLQDNYLSFEDKGLDILFK